MKKTHQIGLMIALLAGVAFTTPTHDPVQRNSTPTSSDKGLSTRPDPVRDLQLTHLGVRLAYSFGM